VSNPGVLDTTEQDGATAQEGGLSNAVAICSHHSPELVLNAWGEGSGGPGERSYLTQGRA